MELISSALRVLRLYNAGTINVRFRDSQAYIDIKGLLDFQLIPTFIKQDDRRMVGFENRAYTMPLVLNKQNRRLIEKYELDTVANIVAKGESRWEKDDVRRRIATAVELYGTAVNIRSNPETLVTLMSALEALLLEERDSRETLALRCSVLMNEDSGIRRRVYKDVRELYSLRNNILHKGMRDVSDAKVYKLSQLCFQSIVALARKTAQVRTFSQFRNWILEELLDKQIPVS